MSILGPSKATLEIVWRRDHGRCAKCGEFIVGERGLNWSLHHRRPRGMGGTSLRWVNLPANLVLLHGHGRSECHGEVESDRQVAYDAGFLVAMHGLERADEVSIEHAVHGPCFLDDEGGVQN